MVEKKVRLVENGESIEFSELFEVYHDYIQY